ncbi:MAG: ribonuclease R [Planctomycetota bacterium]
MDSERRRTLRSRASTHVDGPDCLPAPGDSLAERFGVRKREIPAFLELLYELEEEGIAVHVEGRGWCSPRREGWLVGTMSVTRAGFGFVRPAREDPRGDVFVPASKLRDAHHGDLALVKLRKPRGKRRRERPGEAPAREGRVIDVLRRSPRIITGIFERLPTGGGCIEPLSHDSVREIYVEPGRDRGAEDGQRVLARLIEGDTVGGLPPGEVVEISAPEGSWLADLQLIAAEHDLREDFPSAVEEEARRLSSVIGDAELEGRSDLRDRLIFTIDPRDAEDFDDAITLEERGDGSFLLGVCIADVSAFVKPGSELDREALRRGTSVYLPGRVFPMLPERISNELCSLRPGEDRLVKVVWMEISPGGELLGHRVERGVMRSARRFAYSEVEAILEGGTPARGNAGERQITAMLERMDRLRILLHRRRLERGALDLDLPETRLIFGDEGEVVDVGIRERLRANHLVEEFMLLANESVALEASARQIPILRRIHDAPPEEDIEVFQKFCRILIPGVKAPDAQGLQPLIEAVRGEPVATVVNLALLRTLTQAEYSAGKALHFALATDEYCHFTSPIRRYPDLLVHRALDGALFGDFTPLAPQLEERVSGLDEIAQRCSRSERKAEAAEREMVKLRAIAWLARRVGERFTGVISRVSEYGFYVRLDTILIEGMVHISSLGDDFYIYSESQFALRGRSKGRRFRLGDAVEVLLHRTDPIHRHIDLRYLHHRK